MRMKIPKAFGTVLLLFCISRLMTAQTDSEKIAFQSRRSGSSQIYIMNTEGSDIRRLTKNSFEDLCPVISPDGSKIAFLSNRDGENKIYLMNVDGSDQHRLTVTSDEEDSPTWSPDGERIYFRTVIGNTKAICGINIDRSGFKQLLKEKDCFMPAISPDETKIIFNSTRAGHFEIWIAERGGNDKERIAESIDWGMGPCWSPDGTRISYTHYSEAPSPFNKSAVEIHVMNSDGRDDRAITKLGSTSEYPCWSPDGKHIAFQTYRDGNFEIYIVDSDGSNLRRVTNDEAFDGRPSWGVVKEK